jgi:hypothetical protein
VEVKLGVGAVAVDDHASHVEIVALKEVGGARVVARDGVDLVFAVVREHLPVVGGSTLPGKLRGLMVPSTLAAGRCGVLSA